MGIRGIRERSHFCKKCILINLSVTGFWKSSPQLKINNQSKKRVLSVKKMFPLNRGLVQSCQKVVKWHGCKLTH